MQENKSKCLVIGDSMIDKHTHGVVSRISPEAPVPIIDAEAESSYSLGAAGNVAAQMAAAGYKTFFAYKAYKDSTDSHERFARMCEQANVKSRPLEYPLEPGCRHPVTTKERIWAGDQQICRIDREDVSMPNEETEKEWIMELQGLIETWDIECVIFSDYNKGTLTDRLIQKIADFCWDNDMITVLDPKRYSYWGLQHLTLIKPNRKEVEITNMTPENISRELGETYLLNTLGADGMKLWQDGECTEEFRAFSDDVIDVCGCGDTVTALIAIGLIRGWTIGKVIRVASHAADMNMKAKGCYILSASQIDILSTIPVR